MLVVGKSTVTKECYHLLHRNQTVGVIALEESVRESIRSILGIAISKKLNDEDVRKEIKPKDIQKHDDFNTRLYFYDHFGSLNGNDILANIRYLAVACKCKYIILDHITIVLSG